MVGDGSHSFGNDHVADTTHIRDFIWLAVDIKGQGYAAFVTKVRDQLVFSVLIDETEAIRGINIGKVPTFIQGSEKPNHCSAHQSVHRRNRRCSNISKHLGTTKNKLLPSF